MGDHAQPPMPDRTQIFIYISLPARNCMETILAFIHAALLLCRVNLAETLEANAT
jgi:hypothetical protein